VVSERPQNSLKPLDFISPKAAPVGGHTQCLVLRLLNEVDRHDIPQISRHVRPRLSLISRNGDADLVRYEQSLLIVRLDQDRMMGGHQEGGRGPHRPTRILRRPSGIHASGRNSATVANTVSAPNFAVVSRPVIIFPGIVAPEMSGPPVLPWARLLNTPPFSVPT
jgi:hypothetical protein